MIYLDISCFFTTLTVPYLDFGARIYDPFTASWLSPDPLAADYPGISPYAYCAGDPMNLVDPEGTSPIYSETGVFLGTDDMGLSGRYIIMQSDNFIQGMAHETALDFNIATLNYIEKNIKKHYDSLPLRPDYDGFITISEGVKWAKTHIGAKNNPNPENTLYIDASKMDFGDIDVGEFSSEGDVSSLNLLNWNNIAGSWFNHRLRSSVYALGRFKAQLINSKAKTIVIINDDSTVYDWNKGGGLLRNLLITLERGRAHLGDDHGFNVYYYGTGYLR